jgi:hypothetical protein
MIEQNKMHNLASCNNCSGYNIQPNTHCNIKFKECGEVYQYIFAVGNAGIELRLCNKCASELKELLEKQLGEKKIKALNSKLTKTELKCLKKEELIDLHIRLHQDYTRFMQTIFTATTEQFEDMKKLYNILNIAVNEEDR